MDGMDAPTRTTDRRRWARVVLTLPPDASDSLGELARDNYRAPRAEALRLLVDAIARERRRVAQR